MNYLSLFQKRRNEARNQIGSKIDTITSDGLAII